MMHKFGIALILTTLALAQSAAAADGERKDHKNTAPAVSSASHSAVHPHQPSATSANTHTAPKVHDHQSHSGETPCHADLARHDHNSVHSGHDHVALTEMHSHVVRHLGNVHAQPHTFGVAHDWSHDWELRWIDYSGAHGGHVRVYHAMHKHNPGQRYTMVSELRHPHPMTWHPVH